MGARRSSATLLVGATLAVLPRAAHAFDGGTIDGAPVRADITWTSIFATHFDNRNDHPPHDAEHVIDDHYTELINRFNLTLGWKSWQAGVRFDTATYLQRPSTSDLVASGELAPENRRSADVALSYRYRDQYLVSGFLPSKFYLTYAKPDVELTLGDGYVSFGRGLVLSMRKIDELGVDTSLQGAKVTARLRPFTFTAVVGLSNPGRVDEATGVALRDPDPSSAAGESLTRASWSHDAIVGLRAEARADTVTFGVHAADVHRMDDLKFSGDPTSIARDIGAVGASIAIPRLSAALPLNIYGEVAVQRRSFFDPIYDAKSEKNGVAAYSSISLTRGAFTASVEGKHYRSYYAAHINADLSRFGAFKAVQYNAPPTVERITQDSLFDNSCVTGGRARFDVKPTKALLVYASGAYFANFGEQISGKCGVGGGFGVTQTIADTHRNDVWDGYLGVELRSQTDASYLLLNAGLRKDTPEGETLDLYREAWIQGDFVQTLDAIWSIEVSLLHRKRYESGGGQLGETWHEGDTAFALKHGSQYFVFIGHEYTTRLSDVKPGAFLVDGPMQHFINGGAQVKLGDAVSVRLFVGQQRGALKCVSGVCRQFPAFEGAKVEAVIRY